MNRVSPGLLCQIYLIIVLAVASILSPPPYLPLAIVLLLAMLFLILRRLYPSLRLVITTATIFLLPLILKSLLGYLVSTMMLSHQAAQIIAVVATLPAIYLLDCNLRQNAPGMAPAPTTKNRSVTYIPQALFTSAIVILVASFILNNTTLLFTDIMLIVYLVVILIIIWQTIPRLPINVSTTQKRIIAGTTGDINLKMASKSPLRLYITISPTDSWVKVKPQRFTLDKAQVKLNAAITPPLAGPSHPQLQASVIDQWGFTQTNQIIEPVELHVIPRAKYAEWLAMKYLEESGAAGTAATASPRVSSILRRGIEYFDSRDYQAGDSLRDIDWKHTVKLNQLIVKEYSESGRQAAIISVNLSVSDAEEADKLAFNLLTTALTLAGESIPTALAAYNHQKVVLTTATIDPREALKQTLLLTRDITLTKFGHRFLQIPDVVKLRRNISQLKEATSEPAQRLLNMLNLEHRAIEKAAKTHPATLALSSVTEHMQPPAIVLLVSHWNHDAEALLVATGKLSRGRFITLPIEPNGGFSQALKKV